MKRGRFHNVRIKKEFIYTREMSEESSYIKVERYKIKNWELIRKEL
jgi:hypothetical protein